MYILAMETTGAFASVALMKDSEIIGQISGSDRFSHLQNLMPQVEAVVKGNKLSLDDIGAIAVSCGPGSFTGIRIGVSSARALSQILDLPCLAVSSLEALALRGRDAKDENLLICPMLDARRNQVYAGGYLIKDGFPREVIEAGPYMLDEFLSKTGDYNRILLLGDAVDKYGEEIKEIRSEGVSIADEDSRYQDASTVAELGLKIYNEGGALNYEMLEPNYMRMAEAERRLKEEQRKG